MKNILLLLCISIIILCSCGRQSQKEELIGVTDKLEEIDNSDIYVKPVGIECQYIEPVNGKVNTFNFSVQSNTLENVLNDWINELSKLEISYGNMENGVNILDELLVVDAHLEETEVIIVMNEAFKGFKSSSQSNYTNPGYFLFGLKDILSQIIDADSMTINYSGKESDVINPEGYVIDNILLKEK